MITPNLFGNPGNFLGVMREDKRYSRYSRLVSAGGIFHVTLPELTLRLAVKIHVRAISWYNEE